VGFVELREYIVALEVCFYQWVLISNQGVLLSNPSSLEIKLVKGQISAPYNITDRTAAIVYAQLSGGKNCLLVLQQCVKSLHDVFCGLHNPFFSKMV